MGDKVKVAVIGCGHLGKWHVQKAIQLESSELIGIVEVSPVAVAAIKEQYPDQRVVSNIDEIMEEIDAAIIVVPTAFHHQVAMKLLRAGKHIFCEKPLTSTYEEALELKVEAEKRNLVVQVGHSERFHQIWEEKKNYPKFFDKPATIRINRMAPFKGRAVDVDVVQDLMIHDLDLICHLFDDQPVSVQSMGHKIRTDKWDFVSSKFTFDSGRDAFITVARNHIKEVRDMEITNEHGCFYIDLFKNEVLIASDEANEAEGFVRGHTYPKRDHLLEEQTHFYQSILESKPAIVDVDDGILAVKLVNIVLQSLEGKGPVDIK